MLPRWHIFYGLIFTLIIWAIIPETNLYMLLILFLSSFLIDFDHYLSASLVSGKWKMSDIFDYYRKDSLICIEENKKGIYRRGIFQIFHTIEVNLIVLILGLFWTPAFYVFAGMVFHSLIDIYDMGTKGYLYRREFFLLNWIKDKIR